MIEVICPLCEQALTVPEEEIGTTGHCSKCKGHISVLEALEPIPRAEVPPAPLRTDPGDGAAGAAMYRPQKRSTATGEVLVEASPEVQRSCLVRILIDLNQAVYLYRYKRNEFPKTKKFTEEREARDAWWEKVGAFGHVLFDTNIKRRLDNIQDALEGLPGEPYREIRDRLTKGLHSPEFMSTEDMVRVVETIREALHRLDEPANSA